MKQKLKLSITLGSIALLLMGCGSQPEPEFNRSNKLIAFKEGKPYAIPNNSYYNKLEKLHMDTMKKTANVPTPPFDNAFSKLILSAKAGAPIAIKNCKINDLYWIKEGNVDKVAKELNPTNQGDKNLIEFLVFLASMPYGEAGCEKPLSKQEYAYRLQQEKDMKQMMMHQQQMNMQQQQIYTEQQSINAINQQTQTIQMQQTNQTMQNMLDGMKKDKPQNVNVYLYQ